MDDETSDVNDEKSDINGIDDDRNSDNDVKPWTIRGVNPEERHAAIAAAKRANTAIGDWLARAIRTQIKAEAQVGRAVAKVRQPQAEVRQARLEQVERIAATLRDLAAAGVTVEQEHANKITSALVAHLPVVRQKRANGQTEPAPASDSPTA